MKSASLSSEINVAATPSRTLEPLAPERPLSLSGWLTATVHTSIDLLVLAASAWFAYWLRTNPTPLYDLLNLQADSFDLSPIGTERFLGLFLLYATLTVLIFWNLGLQRTTQGRPAWAEALRAVAGLSIAAVLVIAIAYVTHIAGQTSRFLVLGTWGLSVVGVGSWRVAKRYYIESCLRQGLLARNVLIVGAGRVGHQLAHFLKGHPELGLRVCGFADDHAAEPEVLGPLGELSSLLQKHFIEEVYITIPSERELVKQTALEARRLGIDVKLLPELYDGLLSNTQLSHLGNLPVLELYRLPIPEVGVWIKRAMDIGGALVGLIVGVPLMLAIAIAIKLDDGGPIIYKSKRVGKKGRIFDCYKFRTMVPNSDALQDQLRPLNERKGLMFKITNDPRVTRVGRFLRKYNLDEWLQFWNVLKGDMSLVGPRPPTFDEVEQYKQHKLEYYRRLDVKPGMTSPWAVKAQRDPDFERAVQLDLYYIENWSLWLDLKILLKTIPTVLRGVGR